MKKLPFIFSSIILLSISCRPFKKASIITEDNTDPIQIAISDFSRNCRLYKKSDVFYVGKRNVANKGDILIVSVIKNSTKLLLTAETIVGSKGKIASKYFVSPQKKLFYWWDKDYPLTKAALAIFGKYNLLQDDVGGEIILADNYIDEKQQSAIYYFCKNNLAIFKRIEQMMGGTMIKRQK